MGYVLNEIPTARGRLLVIESLFTRLADDGIMILIEPGSPKGFRFVNDFRNFVVEKTREEACIVAPCPHHGKCPLAEHDDDWCHFSQRGDKFPNNVFPKYHMEWPTVNEKYSYLVVKKGRTVAVELKEEKEAVTMADKSFFWSRVIKPTIKKQQHVIVDLCTAEEKKQRLIVAKSHGGEGGYKDARRTNWGDLWYIPKWIPNKFRKETSKGKRLW